jgi:hypothetical protein
VHLIYSEEMKEIVSDTQIDYLYIQYFLTF